MPSLGFQFKQFFIAHDRCAMKVNTDGILLGAIAEVENVARILDLGTGSGLVAVMLAQRAPTAEITALELEENAYLQAVENGKKSAFSDRLQFFQGDVMTTVFPQKFDLIVSNPPYFADSLPARNAARDLARAANQSHFNWLQRAQMQLSPSGKITFILPTDTAEKLMPQAESLALHCISQWQISPKTGKPPKRTILTFSPQFQPLSTRFLDIYNEKGQYSEDFRRLTRDFYLNF